MNILDFTKQVEVISALAEGCSIRGTERLTGAHRDTIMRLGASVGHGYTAIHNKLYRDLNLPLLEVDEVFGYVGKKNGNLEPHDPREFGDQYTFTAIDSIHKNIVSYYTGKRDASSTNEFMVDLRQRVINVPQISSDAFSPYPDAISDAFSEVHYGQVIKQYLKVSSRIVVGVSKRPMMGRPNMKHISTSYIEKWNGSLRQHSRRWIRRTTGYSKSLENHRAAVGLFVGYYNLCKVHQTVRMTPAMSLGVTDHIWSVAELVDRALNEVCPN